MSWKVHGTDDVFAELRGLCSNSYRMYDPSEYRYYYDHECDAYECAVENAAEEYERLLAHCNHQREQLARYEKKEDGMDNIDGGTYIEHIRSSITDELRDCIRTANRSYEDARNPYNDREVLHIPEEELLAIADRIDAAHEKAVTAAHSNGITEYGSMVAREYVKLPVDADGECIHIGDVMETDNGIREVDVLQKSSRKWSVGLVPVGGGAFSWHDAETLRHHRVPTVEDVLTKMLEQAVGYSDAHTTVALNTIAEYAAKLRLAGEGA